MAVCQVVVIEGVAAQSSAKLCIVWLLSREWGSRDVGVGTARGWGTELVQGAAGLVRSGQP